MDDILSQIIAYAPDKIDTETKARALVQAPRNMDQEPRNMYGQGSSVDHAVRTIDPVQDSGNKIEEVLKAYGKYRGSRKGKRPMKFKNFFELYATENFATGGSAGQLVSNTVDGSRPGYNGKDAYAINRDKKRTEAKEKGKVYDLKTKRFRKSKVPVSQYGAGASSDMKEYMKQYYKDTKEYTESGKLQIERDKKLKEFIGNKKKISSTALRDFVINELGYENYRAAKFQKRFPNLEIVKDIKYRPDAKPLTKQQKTIVMENFDLPEGVEKWDFKQHKYGISNTKYNRLYDQIKNRIDDKIKYKVAGNFSLPKGWMMNAMNRLYENQTVLKDGKRVLKEGVKKLTYEPKFNKNGIIIGFKDNTASGKNNTYYATEKAANKFGDGTDWAAHGDYSRISKFIKIANGVKEKPNKVLQKILNKKGLNIPGLTLNDVLSHQRYYSTLAETKPSELIKRQIVLHHKKGVGDQILARAAATKDIQLLTGAINSDVIKLENIVKGTSTTPGRKLNVDEIAKLKNYGAKITDFDGKVVGGGYTDPTKQFAAIEKEALKYAKGDQFNVKTVANYLERLGCGGKFGGGGRINFADGVPSLTKCAKKGVTKLENGLKSGFKNADDAVLARGILKSGKFFKDAVSLRGLLGPAALGFTALAEAGFVSYDMLSKGKSFREAIGDSLFNYVVKGTDYEIDSDEEFIKRLKSTGNMSDEQIGKMLNFKSVIDDMNRGFNLNTKLQDLEGITEIIKPDELGADRFADIAPKKQIIKAGKILDNQTNQAIDSEFFSDNAFNLDAERDALRADIQDYNRTGTPRRVTDYLLSDKAKEGADASALANLYVKQDQLQDAGTGDFLPKVDQGIARNLKQTQYDINNLLNPKKLDEFGEYFMSLPKGEQSTIMSYGYPRYMEGGIASLNVNKK